MSSLMYFLRPFSVCLLDVRQQTDRQTDRKAGRQTDVTDHMIAAPSSPPVIQRLCFMKKKPSSCSLQIPCICSVSPLVSPLERQSQSYKSAA